MEEVANTVNSVHVLRHSFRPSEHLGSALEHYMKEGATHPPFLLYATRLISLSTERRSIHEINAEFETANREFINRHDEQVVFSRDNESTKVVGARLLANGALRVGMLPANYEKFQSLLSGFDALPDDTQRRQVKPIRYFVHADIPATSLDIASLEAASTLIEEELSIQARARMYYATPSAVDRRIIRIPSILPAPKQHE